MKEFSIEEKAKAYDEALERAREYWETDNDNTLDIKAKGTMEYLFPELAGSKDERIRKWLIGYFHQYKEDGMEKYANGLKVESIIAWLEKQGKQKSQRMISAEAKEAMYKKPADTVEQKCEESKTKIFDAPTPFEDKLYAFVAACEFLTLPSKIEFIKEHSQELLDAAKEQAEKKHEENMELIKGLLEELNKKTFKPPFDIKTFPESKTSDQFKPFDPWGQVCVYACPPTPYDPYITTSTTNTLNKEDNL